MRVLYKKEKGVSPVIATILMVAITVVLASAVYLMVSGYIGSSPSKPVTLSFSVSNNGTATQFLVISGNISISSSTPLIITIANGANSTAYKFTSITNTSTTGPIKNQFGQESIFLWLSTISGSHYLAAGDVIGFGLGSSPSSTAPLPPGTTVTFTYQNNVIYKYTV